MFKIGDIIKGIEGNDYSITDEKMTKGIVTRLIPEDNVMEIEILEHEYKNRIGDKLEVDNSSNEFVYYFSTKYDLQNGDIVYLRNGNVKIYANESFFDFENCNENDDIDVLNDLNDDLTYKYNNKDYDIIKVSRPKEYEELYKREIVEPKEMTLKEVCDILGYEVKIKKED